MDVKVRVRVWGWDGEAKRKKGLPRLLECEVAERI